MTLTCPECGAHLAGDQTCQAIFESFLVLEFTDAAYGRAHMLTVACFMIQHGRYSDEALAWIEQKLRLHLEEGVQPERILRMMTQEASPGQRTWKVTRPPGASLLPQIAWSMTIADVADRYEDAESYCDLVRQWARTTLEEMKPLLGRAKE